MNADTRIDVDRPDAVKKFILANTVVLAPPLVPELKLHLAEESMPLWHKTEEELGELNLPPPYWAFAWAGGQALSRYILDHPEVCRGKRVLDLGSGSGMCAISACLAGAASVIASDVDRIAVSAMQLNATLNGVELEVPSCSWLDEGLPAGDVVLLGDVFYEKALATNVMAVITEGRRRGLQMFVGDPSRSYFPNDRFELIAGYEVPQTRELEDAEIKSTAVWKLRDASAGD